jgi:DNA topoisomerase IB
VGGEDYAAENDSYGLATLQKRHVRVGDGAITFDYPAKSGQQRFQRMIDPEIYPIVEKLKRRRGGTDDLLAYQAGRDWRDVRSDDVNEYIKALTGADFSAKDFRTWHATVLAAVALAVSFQAARSKTAQKRAVTRAVKEVAHYLGNTPAVARSSYIDPRVFDRYESGLTIAGVLPELFEESPRDEPWTHHEIEEAVLDLIAGDEESQAIAKVA